MGNSAISSRGLRTAHAGGVWHHTEDGKASGACGGKGPVSPPPFLDDERVDFGLGNLGSVTHSPMPLSDGTRHGRISFPGSVHRTFDAGPGGLWKVWEAQRPPDVQQQQQVPLMVNVERRARSASPSTGRSGFAETGAPGCAQGLPVRPTADRDVAEVPVGGRVLPSCTLHRNNASCKLLWTNHLTNSTQAYCRSQDQGDGQAQTLATHVVGTQSLRNPNASFLYLATNRGVLFTTVTMCAPKGSSRTAKSLSLRANSSGTHGGGVGYNVANRRPSMALKCCIRSGKHCADQSS